MSILNVLREAKTITKIRKKKLEYYNNWAQFWKKDIEEVKDR